MPFSHALDPAAIVDEDAHPLGQEGAFIALQLARSLTKATGEDWTTQEFDEDEARLERPPQTNYLVYAHHIVRERDGFPCKVLVQRGRDGARLAFVLEGQDYDDAFDRTWRHRGVSLGPIDVPLTPEQFAGDPHDHILRTFVRHADAVWSRVHLCRSARETLKE